LPDALQESSGWQAPRDQQRVVLLFHCSGNRRILRTALVVFNKDGVVTGASYLAPHYLGSAVGEGHFAVSSETLLFARERGRFQAVATFGTADNVGFNCAIAGDIVSLN
jgi:hypothetical protein